MSIFYSGVAQLHIDDQATPATVDCELFDRGPGVDGMAVTWGGTFETGSDGFPLLEKFGGTLTLPDGRSAPVEVPKADFYKNLVRGTFAGMSPYQVRRVDVIDRMVAVTRRVVTPMLG